MAHQRSKSEGRKRGKAVDEIKLGRSRGDLACAECRRSKLKCDRNVPCYSCIRRGCKAICPNGILSYGQGSRSVSEIIELRNKVADMGNRIRQLEDALTIAHAATSQTTHPLLTPALLETNHSISKEDGHRNESYATRADELDKDIMLSFGNLTLAESDVDLEVLLTTNIDPDNNAGHISSDASSQSELPSEIMQLSRTFLFAPSCLPEDEIQELIEQRLPTYERASALCESYLQHIAWLARPINREQLIEELLPAAYQERRGRSSTRASSSPAREQEKTRMDPHDLATLLMVFAAGAVGDFTLSPGNDEAELYLHLGRAALGLKPVLERASLSAVQAVALMGIYDFFSCRKKSLESTWKVLAFAMMLATSIGLHRDHIHWKFGTKMIQRRREVFWEIMFLDSWKCIASGRPTGVHMDDVDCELPIDSDATLDEEGKEVPSFWRWKHMLLRDVLLSVIQRLVSAKPLKYTDILILDRKLREFGPRDLEKQIANQIGEGGLGGADGIRVYLQKYVLGLNKNFVIQILHRNFFARALLESPGNPMKSTFAPSFLAAYNAALAILRVVRELFKIIPHVMLRSWSALTHSLGASMVLGSVAARVPASEMAPQAYINLALSIGTLMKAQSHPAIQAGLPGLLRLREKARVALIGVGVDPDQIVEDSKVMSERETQVEKDNNLRRHEEAFEINKDQTQYRGATSSDTSSSTEWQAVNSEENRMHPSAPGSSTSSVTMPKNTYIFGDKNSETLAPLANDGPFGREATGIEFLGQDGFDFSSDIDIALDITPEQYIQSLQAPTVSPFFSTPSGANTVTAQENHYNSLQGNPIAVGLRDESYHWQKGMECRNNTSQLSFGLQESEFAALMALDAGPPNTGASMSSSYIHGKIDIIG